MTRKIALFVGISLLMACGGGQQKPETPEDEPMFDESTLDEQLSTDEQPSIDDEESKAEHASTGPVSEFGDRPPPIPEDWELKQRDCDELVKKYEQLLLVVEMEKLEKRKLQPKYRPAAEKNVRKTAKTGAQNWMQACQDIVGTIQSKERWECAYQAGTLDRFTGCLDGKFEDEAD